MRGGATAPRMALLFALYVVQGMPFGFQASALPVFLRAQGASLTSVGLLGLLAAPWLLKPLWAPIVDTRWSRRVGRRRSWLIPMNGLLALTALCGVVAADQGSLEAMLVVVFMMNFFAATQDIAVDGLAVDLLGERELGPGNAVQVVGYKIGMLLGGGLLVWASAWVGFPGLFAAMAFVVALVLVAVLRFAEPRPSEVEVRRPPPLREAMWRVALALRFRGGVPLLVVVATYKLGESACDAMFKPFLVDAGFTPAQVGLWLGTFGMVASLLGSAAGGWLAYRFSIWPALVVTAALRVLPLAGEWGLSLGTPSAGGVVAITLAEHFAGGMLTTAMFAFMMSRVDTAFGATHFTVLAAVEVLGKGPAAWSSGVLAELTGYSTVFGLGVMASALFLPLLWLVRPERRDPAPA